MNIGELDNRARIILKGSGLAGENRKLESISSITLIYISPKEIRVEPV